MKFVITFTGMSVFACWWNTSAAVNRSPRQRQNTSYGSKISTNEFAPPTHHSKSVCKHLKTKQIWLRPERSSQQTWKIKRTIVAKFLSRCSWFISFRYFRICVWTLNLNENIYKITHDFFSTPAVWLLFQKFVQANNKENIKAQNQWSFVRGLWLDCCVTKTSQPVTSYTKLWMQMDIYELIYS